MRSFLSWVLKEAREGARSYRFLIVGIAASALALMGPVMLRLLPVILKARVGADLVSLIPASRDFAFESFVGDVYEILSAVVCVALGGIVSRERKDRAFVIPVSKGAVFPGIVGAKIVVWAAYLAVVVFLAVFACYIYAGVLFGAEAADLSVAARAAFNLSLYFAYVVSLTVFMSSFTKSAAAASLLALAAVYGIPAIGSLLGAAASLPPYLAVGSSTLATLAEGGFVVPTLLALASGVAFWLCSSALLRKVEL